jgi:hypothetical protein
MAIKSASGPIGVSVAMGATVAHLLARGPGATEPTGGKDAKAAPSMTPPIPLYLVALNQITGARFLADLTPVAWRYFILGQGPVAVADLRADKPGAAPRVTDVSRGRLADRLLQATDLADTMFGKQAAIYEPGVIEIPALQIVELWLHGSQLDVFIKVSEGATNAKAPVELDPDFIDRVLTMALAKTGMHSLSP